VDSVQERLKAIRKQMSLTQREFAELIGVSRDVVASWEIGRVQPSEAVQRLISRECGISHTWLRDGEGGMAAPGDDADAEKLLRILEGDNAFMKTFLCGLADLPKEAWEQIERFMKGLQHGREN
jgi:DNA-binding transcriptional regulator YiaG